MSHDFYSWKPVRRLGSGVRLCLLLGVALLALMQNDCGSTYPDSDPFKELNRGFENYYYFTNLAFNSRENAAPELVESTVANRMLFLIDRREDIYYNKGFEFEPKDYDARWFLQVDNATNNYYLFQNVDFGTNIKIQHYALGAIDAAGKESAGESVLYTNGYLMITQAGPNNWLVNFKPEDGSRTYPTNASHRLGNYINGIFSYMK